MTGAYNCFIYLPYITTAVHFYKSRNLHKRGLCGPHVSPAQSSSTPDSHACTSTTISLNDSGSREVECPGEQPPAVVSESDRWSSKVRHSSSSMIDPHSHDHHHLCGLASCSISPCQAPCHWMAVWGRLPPVYLLPRVPLLPPVHLPLPPPVRRSHWAAHEVVGPEPCNVGPLLGSAWHIIHQCHG